MNNIKTAYSRSTDERQKLDKYIKNNPNVL
jgi:hypothetical protein